MAGKTLSAPINFKMRFPALNGVRATAVTLAFLFHYTSGVLGEGGRLIHLLYAFNWLFVNGVDLSLVLSGFLITSILYDTRDDSRFFLRFYARRSLRIFPVYYLVAFVLLLLTPILQYRWMVWQVFYLIYAGNCFPHHLQIADHVVVSLRHPIWDVELGHLWSLCAQEQFYLGWSVVVWLVRDRVKLLYLCGGLSLTSLLARFWVYSHHLNENLIFTLPLRLDPLLIGAALALFLHAPRLPGWLLTTRWIWAASVCSFVPAMLLCRSAQGLHIALASAGLTGAALAGVGLIALALMEGSPVFRLFTRRPMNVIGRYSYGFYIFHLICLHAWGALSFRLQRIIPWHSLAILFVIVLSYAMTLLAAKLSYDLYESKFLRWKRSFEYDSEIASHKHAYRVS